MIRDWRLVLIPVAVLAIILGIYFFYQSTHKPETKPIKKPDIVQPQPQTSATKPNWYIKFTVKDQKSTAYTEAPGAPVAASGDNYFLGSGAVHPKYPLNAGGNPIKPIIPFGTTIYLDKPVDIHGIKYKTLIINDTGDVYYGLWRSHPYWIDVYYGPTNYYTDKSARNSGVRLIDYSWYESWK